MIYKNKVNLGNTIWWAPWYGCEKVSSACKNCFIKVKDFVLADINGTNAIETAPPGTIIITSLQTDFFWEKADNYRQQAWEFIRSHPQLIFLILTKRIEHGLASLPDDWGSGWDNVIISVTIDNDYYANSRLPIFRNFPAKHKWLSCSPLVEEIHLDEYLAEGWIEHIECSGEIGDPKIIRETKYEWVKSLSEQCKKFEVRFSFLKCGKKFKHNDNEYQIDTAYCYQSEMADNLNLSYYVPITFTLSNSFTKTI